MYTSVYILCMLNKKGLIVIIQVFCIFHKASKNHYINPMGTNVKFSGRVLGGYFSISLLLRLAPMNA